VGGIFIYSKLSFLNIEKDSGFIPRTMNL